jgi:exportin-1
MMQDSVVQERLIEKYMSLPNEIWDSVIQRATVDLTVLQDLDTIKQLGHILKTNVRACVAVGHPFVLQVWPH